MCISAKVLRCLYNVWVLKHNKCGGWQREAVCDAGLTQPFGSRLSDSARADWSHQAAAAAALIRAMARLISVSTEGFPLREAGSLLSQSRLHSNELWGTATKFPLTLMFWQSHLQWLRADMGRQWRGVWGLWRNRKRSDWLPACLWGDVDACLPPKPYCTKSSAPIRMRTTVSAHRGVILRSWPSALSHTQISIWVKAASLPEFFCKVGHFHKVPKCLSSRLYCGLHIWYHLKILTIN